ncbi:hypothetical protein QYE76_065913 [Lolium multiflorum]|uniref:CCHC-type domain-containing protein n=1 Tax=Lolium multiflorum TaxID=4521 RepID=A0AAD8W9B5_LOLMU|nr:hypothetical protein QYE76_065913 [Lolium multiflorum]
MAEHARPRSRSLPPAATYLATSLSPSTGRSAATTSPTSPALAATPCSPPRGSNLGSHGRSGNPGQIQIRSASGQARPHPPTSPAGGSLPGRNGPATPRGTVAIQGRSYGGHLRVRSMVVRTGPLLESPPARASFSPPAPGMGIQDQSLEWQVVASRRRRRPPPLPSSATSRPRANAPPATGVMRPSRSHHHKKRLRGECFKCLSSSHHISDCRDPVRCRSCRRSGHIAKECRAGPSPCRTAKDRLQPPSSAPPPPPPALMAARPGEAHRRPARSTAVIICTPETESAAQLLHSKAVVLTASDRRCDLTNELVARAVARDCNIPAERFQVSKLRPGCYLVRFDMSWHRDQAMDAGVVSCRGIALTMAPWQQASIRASHRVWRYYCRVAVEGVALNFWTKDVMQQVLGSSVKVDVLEYRSEALDDAQVCYVWCWACSPDDIPRTCDASFLMRMGAAPPMRCSLPDGTPREEGFEDTREPLLIHLDKTKDFAPAERRTPSSRASGIPSPEVALLDAHVPTERFDWKLEVEDANPRARRDAPDMHARLGPRRREDRDDDDDELPGRGGCRPRRPCRDALLGRAGRGGQQRNGGGNTNNRRQQQRQEVAGAAELEVMAEPPRRADRRQPEPELLQEVEMLPVRFDPAVFWQDLARADPMAIEIDAAQGWSTPTPMEWPALEEQLHGDQLVDALELPSDAPGPEVLFGPGVQLLDAAPASGGDRGDRGDREVRGSHADQDVLDLLAAKFGALEVDGATTFLAKVLSLLPPSVMGAIPPLDAPRPRVGRRKRLKGELLPSRRSSRLGGSKKMGARLPCVLEEAAPLELGFDGEVGAAAALPCPAPFDAEEIARIRLDTGLLQGARVALPDAELLSILDMEA